MIRLHIFPSIDFIIKNVDIYKYVQSIPENHANIWKDIIKIPEDYDLEENNTEGDFTSNIINEKQLYCTIKDRIQKICQKSLYSSISSLILEKEMIYNISLFWRIYFHNLHIGFVSIIFLFAFLNAFNSESNVNLHLTTKIVTYISFVISIFISLCICQKRIFFNWYTIHSFIFLIVSLYATIAFSVSYRSLLSDKKWIVVFPTLIYCQQLLQALHVTYISYIDDMIKTCISISFMMIISIICVMAIFCSINPNFVIDENDPLALFTTTFSYFVIFSLTGLTNKWYDYVTMYIFIIMKIILIYIVLVKNATTIKTHYDNFVKNDLSIVAVHRLYVMWPYITYLQPLIKDRNIAILKSDNSISRA